jgi:transaldolase
MPANTISAFEQHGRVRETVGEGIEEAHRVMAQLRAPGIDFAEVAAQLEAEGIQKFVEPYSELMRYIETKCQA